MDAHTIGGHDAAGRVQRLTERLSRLHAFREVVASRLSDPDRQGHVVEREALLAYLEQSIIDTEQARALAEQVAAHRARGDNGSAGAVMDMAPVNDA
jgi:hypothetical protein